MGRLEGKAALVNRWGAGEGRPGVISLVSDGPSYYVDRTFGPNGGDVVL